METATVGFGIDEVVAGTAQHHHAPRRGRGKKSRPVATARAAVAASARMNAATDAFRPADAVANGGGRHSGRATFRLGPRNGAACRNGGASLVRAARRRWS